MRITLWRDRLLDDISNQAYVAADVEEGKETPHRLHQTYDICEEGNLPLAERLMGLALAEISIPLAPLLGGRRKTRELSPPEGFPAKARLTLTASSAETEKRLRPLPTLLHEYIVARVLAEWLSVTLPASSTTWHRKAREIMQTVADLAQTEERLTGPVAFSRPCSPF